MNLNNNLFSKLFSNQIVDRENNIIAVVEKKKIQMENSILKFFLGIK